VRALAIIDGEHYAPVVRDALRELPHDVVAAYLAGGTEKLRGGEEYGVPLVQSLEEGVALYAPELVYDLSDEPVLGPRERFLLASRSLALGVPYAGADFRFDPPVFEPFDLPSLSILGTGKRVGKTAVSGYTARLLASDREVVVVAMGRGGPPEPDVADAPPTFERLLELSRAGQHAASDYLEDAALARVVTVGCRRCGGGLAGRPVVSNVAAGAEIAAALDPDLVIFEGSGSALPPIATPRRLLVAGAHQPPELVTGYLNAYRILVSDLVVLTMAEPGSRHEELATAVRAVKPGVPVIAAVLRPRPATDVAGRAVAFFSTAPPEALERQVAHLRDQHGANVVHASGNLARRDELGRELEALEADVFLFELKAAAIDVVAEAAAARGAELVLADNEPLALPGQPELDTALRALADAAAPAPAVPA
jgi:cyclic 2,3-diphosphoglycerate synthetase